MIVAMDQRGVIGRGNELPWRLPADLAWFKKTTMGKPLIMGRRTHESIGFALPGRLNIVLSRGELNLPEGCVQARNSDEALSLAAGNEEVMIIGGAGVYELFASVTDRLYRTTVQGEVEGDVQFPELDVSSWTLVRSHSRPADEKNSYDLIFDILDR